MKVSIIIPCYNGEATIAEAVESALMQTHGNCEVIVVDDGSTDGSLRVLKSFRDRILLLSEPNRGGAAARNLGIAASRGEYIQFLDADDILRPEKVALCANVLSQLPKGVVPITDWAYQKIDLSRPLSVLSFPWEHSNVLRTVLEHPLQTSAPLHRRTTLREIGGFRETLKCAQEKDLHLRLVASGFRFHRIPYLGVVVRQKTNSVSSNYVRVLLQRLDVYMHLAELLQQTGQSLEWQRDLANSLTRDAFDLCHAGQLEDGLDFIALATELDPKNKGFDGLYSRSSRWLARMFGVRSAAKIYFAAKYGSRLQYRENQ